MTSSARTIACAVAALCLLGCSRETCALSGAVRYDGKPLESGFLTVFPIAGEGVSKGTEIVDGHFQLDGLATGSARVLITTPPRLVADAAAKSGIKALPQTTVPSTANGNRRVIELQPGPQTIDFDLTSPEPPPPKKTPR